MSARDDAVRSERRRMLVDAAVTFVTIFLSSAFLVTATFFLFGHWVIDMPEEQIRQAAPITFANVVLLSALFMAVHLIRNHFTVTRPVRKIRRGLAEITAGNLDTRIAPEGNNPAFDSIIDGVNTMASELSTVETLKTDFISNVSHEIKTPLASMRNYSRLLQSDGLTDGERREYAANVESSAVRMSALIENILRLNRLENQQIAAKNERFDLGAQLAECLVAFEDAWEERDIEVEADIADGVFVESDRELLAVVWNNLFSNAFKFTEAGGKVSVVLADEGATAAVTVLDTGCGISVEEGARIFDKFYQADESHATQGNGLGLALVKRIVDIVGAEIEVESALGEGSAFTIRLEKARIAG